MKRKEREQAQRVAAYVDGFVIHRRHADRGAESITDEDREFESLRELVQSLTEMELATPRALQQELGRRIPRIAESTAPVTVLDRLHRFFARAGRFGKSIGDAAGVSPALTTVTLSVPLVFAAFVLIRSFVTVSVVSAKEIVSRSDAALAGLVHPGQLLHRRWKVASTVTGPDGQEVQSSLPVRSIHEWMDGADFDRVAGRWYDGDDHLLVAYTTRIQDGEHRPYVYFSPGVLNEPDGLLNIEPTRKEFDDAVYRFPASVQLALHVYLARQHIYEPIAGERRFNRALIEAPNDGISQMPRVIVSSDNSQALHGTPVFRVRIVDPASIAFNWRRGGPPPVQLAAAEIVRYIDQENYLTVRTEETYRFENGQKRVTSHELVETRTLDASQVPVDPFTLEAPAGTPVQWQSAEQQLLGVADALKRLPRFTSTFDQPRPLWRLVH